MNDISQFVVSHSGWVLFLAIFSEQIGLPLPAAPLLVTAGALAADGVVDPVRAIGVTLVACALADLVWYQIGRTRGEGVLRFLCKLPLCDSSCFGRTERLFAKYGMSAIVAAKFIPGLGLLMPPLAGAFRVRLSRFLCFDTLGALLYALFYLALGSYFSSQVNKVLDFVSRCGLGTGVLALAALLIALAWKLAERRKSTRSHRPAVHRPSLIGKEQTYA